MPGGRPGEAEGVFDLRRLGLMSGGAAHADVPVALHVITLGGQEYVPDPATLEARLDVSGAGAGLGLRLRFAADLRGPCQRCLTDAVVHVDVDARDFQTSGRDDIDEPDPDLDCEYLGGPSRQELDVAAWACDCLLEAVPMSIFCRPDCQGLCVTCGADLNAQQCDCEDDTTDPRWAALGELAERLREDGGGDG